MQSSPVPWFAYVLVGVVVVLVVLQMLFRYSGLAKRMARARKSYRRSRAPVSSATERWALAIGAINGEQLTATIDGLSTELDRERVVHGLQHSWDVSDQTQARGTLQWLLGEGHRVHFAQALAMARTHQSTWSTRLAGAADPERLTRYAKNLVETREVLRNSGLVESDVDYEKGILAWDLCRAVNVARLAYDAGLLDQSTAWSAINEAAKLAHHHFAGWNEVARSYIIGRAMWSGNNSMLEGLIAIAIGLLRDSGSPWRQVDWRDFQRPAS